LAGRTPASAVEAFVRPLQRALSCVTDAVLDVGGGYHPAGGPHAATLAGGLPVPLRGRTGVSLVVALQYQIVEEPGARHWKVRIDAYAYQLLDGKEVEIVSYHWHPSGRSAVTWPHLHLGQASIGRPAILLGAHLPTGRIALEEVIRLAVLDLGVQPRRPDWSDVIRETQETFERWGSWP
jgi:hypothetical protein